MKYVPMAEFEMVSNALNFSNPDIHVIGGCDVYTTKAAGGDMKLYDSIEDRIQSQYQALVRLSESLSPPGSAAGSPTSQDNGSGSNSCNNIPRPYIDLSRASPFGSLHNPCARKTFKYLVATMNASHPDYDFSYKLKPSDFRKERSLQKVMRHVNSTLHNLRPRRHFYSSTAYLAPPPSGRLSRSASRANPLFGPDAWDPMRMWAIIDKDIVLRDCEKYSLSPAFDFDEETALWSMHYFFYNRKKKRVVYLYLRGLSVISHSPVSVPMYTHSSLSAGLSSSEGGGKRAGYWLGNREHAEVDVYGDEDDDEVNDVPYMDLDEIRGEIADGNLWWDEYLDEDDCFEEKWTPPVRGVSEEVSATMEL